MTPTPISPHVSAPRRRAFLARLEECGNVSEATRCADARRSNLYLDRKNDPDFAAAWADAMTACMTVRADVADDFLYRLGVKGLGNARLYQNRVVFYEQEYNVQALLHWLKHNHPKYSEKNPG